MTIMVLLAAVMILAFALRIQDVSQPLVDYFRWRQASTAMMADNLPANNWNPLWPEVSWTGDQRGYQGREFQTITMAAAALNSLFGWRDWHGRMVAVICGTISTLALFRLVSLLHGHRRGLLTAAVYAVLPGAIMIDRSFLPDPAMLAILLLSLWFLAEGLQRKSPLWLVAAWIAGTFSLLAKLPAAAALPAVIYLVAKAAPEGHRSRYLAWLAAALLSSMAIVAPYYMWVMHLGHTYPPFHIAGRGWLWESGIVDFWNNDFNLWIFYWHIETWLWTPAVLLLALPGFISSCLTNERMDSVPHACNFPWFFVSWAFGCTVFYILAAGELRDNSWNLHIFNPVISAFAGAGIASMLEGPRFNSSLLRQYLMAGSAILVIIVTGRAPLRSLKDDSVGKIDYAIGRRLENTSSAGDLVIASGTTAGSPVAILYSRRRGWLFPPATDMRNQDCTLFSGDGPPAVATLNSLISRGARWFGVAKSGNDGNTPPRVFSNHYSYLISFLRMETRVSYEDDSIVIFDLRPLACEGQSSIPSTTRPEPQSHP